MPLYRYKAVTPTGETHEGEMEGIAQSVVVEHLQEMGLIPIRVDETAASTGPGKAGKGLLHRNRISQAEIAVFTQEIATLLRAGLPLDRSLGILIGMSANPQVLQLLTQVREDVRGGAALSAALEAQTGVFSRFYLNMIRAGEAGGSLDVVLQRLSEFMERSKELRETVKSALIYPSILVGVAVLSVAVLLVWVVPQFTQMFEESGKALPLPTQIVIAAGDAVQYYWWAMILGGIGIYTWFLSQLKQAETRYKWDKRFLALPLVGDLVVKLEVARFARTLGTLIGNGVTLLTALSIVKETLSNSVMSEGLGEVATQLKEGQGLGKPLMEGGLFPKLAVHMVMVGEETGKLQEMLTRIADVYDREVQNAVKRMLALMEPLLILGLGLVIGGIIMSVLVAILSVNDLAM
ncbi:MAG: type II secretion system F family protein [Gammaproteobacteria bacterium]|nr:type II secretion system F family protein [Gammaproteobacteria bacterium]MBU1732917.1 type II secretion system F family protein [Gammaproteobacteria bacterium]MBU1891965.1 type II secretion system F family protein [Gammaproteobacteria bacterium]